MKTQHNDEMQWIHHIPQYYDTFLIVKPGFLKRSHIILEVFCNAGYKVVKQTQKELSYIEAEDLYIMHRDKDFFAELCTYMASGFSRGYILKSPYIGENYTINETNKLKNYFRKCYAQDDMRNVLHTSDNFINLRREVEIYFFGEADLLCQEDKFKEGYIAKAMNVDKH